MESKERGQIAGVERRTYVEKKMDPNYLVEKMEQDLKDILGEPERALKEAMGMGLSPEKIENVKKEAGFDAKIRVLQDAMMKLNERKNAEIVEVGRSSERSVEEKIVDLLDKHNIEK